MKELNLYRLAGRLFMEQQKPILHGISREKPQRIAFVLLAENKVVLEINDEFGKLTNTEFDGIIKAVSERYYKIKS